MFRYAFLVPLSTYRAYPVRGPHIDGRTSTVDHANLPACTRSVPGAGRRIGRTAARASWRSLEALRYARNAGSAAGAGCRSARAAAGHQRPRWTCELLGAEPVARDMSVLQRERYLELTPKFWRATRGRLRTDEIEAAPISAFEIPEPLDGLVTASRHVPCGLTMRGAGPSRWSLPPASRCGPESRSPSPLSSTGG